MTWEDFEVDMDSSEVLMKRYKDCLANLLTPHLQAADDEIEFIAAIRENAAGVRFVFFCIFLQSYVLCNFLSGFLLLCFPIELGKFYLCTP
jgi:hypothetical protein